MEEGSEGSLWAVIRKFFSGRSETPVEDLILEAQEEGDLKHDEVQMLLNVVHLGRKKVREIMVPRPDIDCVPLSATVEDVAELIISSGHTRIPIFEETKDHIQGIVHAKDLLKVLLHPELPDRSLASIMRRPFFITENTNMRQLILDFQVRKVHLAIVMDRYGGTSGLVTFEDVLEEIVGEIEDEYDSPRPKDIQHLEDDVLLVSGRTSLDDLQDELRASLDTEQVETVGGFVSHLAGKVPAPGETFQASGFAFQVQEADTKQIHRILVKPLPREQDTAES